MTEKEKYRQIKKEAGFTALALLALILFWLLAGFGLSNVEVKIAHLPLWVWTSSLGVWLMAIILVKLLLTFVFRDMDLGEGGKAHD